MLAHLRSKLPQDPDRALSMVREQLDPNSYGALGDVHTRDFVRALDVQRFGPLAHHESPEAAAVYVKNMDTIGVRDQSVVLNSVDRSIIHEAAHATDHPSRLDRQSIGFSARAYAREEIVAETATIALDHKRGIPIHDGRADYLNQYAKFLSGDQLRDAVQEGFRVADYLEDRYRTLQHQIAVERSTPTPALTGPVDPAQAFGSELKALQSKLGQAYEKPGDAYERFHARVSEIERTPQGAGRGHVEAAKEMARTPERFGVVKDLGASEVAAGHAARAYEARAQANTPGRAPQLDLTRNVQSTLQEIGPQRPPISQIAQPAVERSLSQSTPAVPGPHDPAIADVVAKAQKLEKAKSLAADTTTHRANILEAKRAIATMDTSLERAAGRLKLSPEDSSAAIAWTKNHPASKTLDPHLQQKLGRVFRDDIGVRSFTAAHQKDPTGSLKLLAKNPSTFGPLARERAPGLPGRIGQTTTAPAKAMAVDAARYGSALQALGKTQAQFTFKSADGTVLRGPNAYSAAQNSIRQSAGLLKQANVGLKALGGIANPERALVAAAKKLTKEALAKVCAMVPGLGKVLAAAQKVQQMVQAVSRGFDIADGRG